MDLQLTAILHMPEQGQPGLAPGVHRYEVRAIRRAEHGIQPGVTVRGKIGVAAGMAVDVRVIDYEAALYYELRRDGTYLGRIDRAGNITLYRDCGEKQAA